LVNAADNYQRDKSMDYLNIEINEAEGFVRVHNNGKGIPIVIHKENNMYIPQMIFGHLLTGSNFDD
jgi:DNA topoisomerase-2